jgi:hypothetical protein
VPKKLEASFVDTLERSPRPTPSRETSDEDVNRSLAKSKPAVTAELVFKKSQTSKHGSFAKMRLVAINRAKESSKKTAVISRPMPSTSTDRLASELITALNVKRGGITLAPFGKFFNFVPAMLDDKALSDAMRCCLDARNRRLSANVSSDGVKVDQNLYGKALRSLREATERGDKHEYKTTLMAAVVMHRLEVRTAFV